jgi:3-hydroxymyristoyl/3-hydroxydecanoyl-(acyl carrier protein) dehydratase
VFPDAGFVPIPDLSAAAQRRWRFKIDPHSRCFVGHFDGAPILPAVAHLALAWQACTAEMAREALTGLRDFRLLHPLGPGDEVEVACSDGVAADSVHFEIRCGDTTASTGTLLLATFGPTRG